MIKMFAVSNNVVVKNKSSRKNRKSKNPKLNEKVARGNDKNQPFFEACAIKAITIKISFQGVKKTRVNFHRQQQEKSLVT